MSTALQQQQQRRRQQQQRDVDTSPLLPRPGIMKLRTQHVMAKGIGNAGTTYFSSFSDASVDVVPEIITES